MDTDHHNDSTHIDRTQVMQAIDDFLYAQYYKKAEKLITAYQKAQEADDQAKMAQLTDELAPLQEKFTKDNWFAEFAPKAGQLKFGTHIAKGVHPASKGDNVIYTPRADLPFVGSHSVPALVLDATGNAAALPVAGFFDWQVVQGVRFKDLLLADDPVLKGCFASDPTLSDKYQAYFVQALHANGDNPSSFERNKQLLWAMPNAQALDDYRLIIPLHPSALVYEVFQKINDLRYSEANTQAKDTRFKAKADTVPMPYVSLHDLARVQLGGTKPQNISQLTSRQMGRQYLLPSLPPIFKSNGLKISKFAKNWFATPSFNYHLKDTLQALFDNIAIDHNNHHIREGRREILDLLMAQIVAMAQNIIDHMPAGWSVGYALDAAQKLWLDPHRADSDDDFAQARLNSDYQAVVKRQLADWLQQCLKQRFSKQAHSFSDAEYIEWGRHIDTAFAWHIKQQTQPSSQGDSQ